MWYHKTTGEHLPTVRLFGLTVFYKEVFAMAYVWPIALVVCSNILYQIAAKSVPGDMNPFASLTVTYLVGAAFSAALFFTLGGVIPAESGLWREYAKLNWAPFLLGVVIVGLEAGFIFAYKAGWPVSTATVVQSSFLAVALLIVGGLLYREPISASKIFGVAVCLVGLWFINR
jgi:drug/metabolite transporter (DMT)-like permease